MEIKIAIKAKNALGEGPVWSQDEHALYWVDIHEKKLLRWDPLSNAIGFWKMPSEIGSFALRESGGCVVALKSGLGLLDFGNGVVTPICDVESDLPFTRFNDGKCDRQGRFWSGTMDQEFPNRRGSLYCLKQEEKLIKIRGNVGISNGLGWSPDNKKFYYTDSAIHTIYVYDFDSDNAQISGERVFVKTPENYTPDGLTVDSEGYIWSAMWDGWKIVRFRPDGKIDMEVTLPVQRPTSCTFGGENLDKLYITSAMIDLTEAELKKQPDAGSVFCIELDVKGLADPKYLG